MLKPTISATINFFFIDALLLNIVFQVIIFAWDYALFEKQYEENPGQAIVVRVSQLVFGAAFAQYLRFLVNALNFNSERLWGIFQSHSLISFVVSMLTFVTLEGYTKRSATHRTTWWIHFPLEFFAPCCGSV